MADPGASVLARLRNQANATGRSFQLCLQLFCQEEFLRRLAASDYRDKLVLKGGHLIYCLTEFSSRPTVDIDFLARNTPNAMADLGDILSHIISTPTGNDIVSFEIKHIEQISVGKKYPGLSALLEARIKNTKTPVKIDLGYGDTVFPVERLREIPTQLNDFVAPLVQTYSLETVIAEKLDAILDLMEFSSRMKDYYDIYYLAIQFSFDGNQLQIALIKTFDNRGREYGKDGFQRIITIDQATDMINKWDAFMKKTKLPPIQFEVVLTGIAAFLKPVWNAIHADESFNYFWYPQECKWKAN